MCRNHSHVTAIVRGQAVLTTAGWVTVYQAVGEIKIETPTGDDVIIPASGIFFVPCPDWEGFVISDTPPTGVPTTSDVFLTDDELPLFTTRTMPTKQP
jgi:hypothetical protein